MTKRSVVIGMLVLCAVAYSAFAQSASAEQRAYTCSKEAGSKTFSDAHCGIKEGGAYGHVLIEGTTEVSATNARTASGTAAAAPAKLKGALSGVETETECTTVAGMGSFTNAAASVSGTMTLELTGCSVIKPAGKGCIVAGGAITTNEIAATTVGQASSNVKIGPNAGTEFGSVKIEKCSIAALNNTFPITGSLVATGGPATLSTTHSGTTAQNTLKFGGVKAGLDGALTLGMKTPVGDGEAITLT